MQSSMRLVHLMWAALALLSSASGDKRFHMPGREVQDWTHRFTKHAVGQAASTPKSGKRAERVSKLLEEAEGMEDQQRDKQGPESNGIHVAYLFLAKAGLPLEVVWQAYFGACMPSSFTVLVHQQQTDPLPNTFPANKLTDGVVQGDLRFKYEMVQAMMALGASAFADNKITHFQFLSDSCMPVRSCHSLINYLAAHPGVSFVGNHQQTDQAYLVKNQRCWNGQPNFFKFSMPCYKSSQWVNLQRPHMDMMLNQFMPQQQDFWKGTMVPDEHMIPTILMQNKQPVSGYVLTYAKWPGSRWPEPSAWADMVSQEPECDTGPDLSHPCPLNTLEDPHIREPSENIFFVRKIDATLLQLNRTATQALLNRFMPTTSLQQNKQQAHGSSTKHALAKKQQQKQLSLMPVRVKHPVFELQSPQTEKIKRLIEKEQTLQSPKDTVEQDATEQVMDIDQDVTQQINESPTKDEVQQHENDVQQVMDIE